ncbi:transposase [Phyllobacterium sp. 628]|uniref:helix-turn-helix domain-containing protein n=1 Tax=Phyllobacterium sp. 628 TaxID=2718938 RepID=UPI0016623CE2|nr:helix-turn-helix domain-containing protein [Phyllobacterium sp. 628]QND52787.1 transposase [Phyllobacterium sp. 628]
MGYVSTRTFCKLAGITRERAARLLKKCSADPKYAWRSHTLQVRIAHGCGGRSGIQYQVKVSSLPVHLQDRLKALESSDEGVSKLRFGEEAQFERAWKYEVISAALVHPKHSSERKAEIDRLHGIMRLDWTGQRRRLTRTTLYKWIDIYEFEGIHGLAQKVRSDRGLKKVFINRAWSKAVSFDEATKKVIAEDITQFIRGLIVKGTTRKLIRYMASDELRRLTAAYGFSVNDPLVAVKVFNIPDEIVTAETRFKAVYRHDFDRKASEDNKPRIQRTIAGIAPMEIVVMDVHHINVMVRRADGTVASPKFLAFHDVGTNRVFGEIVFLNERGGVRNIDVIEAFKRMCQHSAFGMPETLYCDNGSEYGFADYLEDALKLNCRVTPFTDADRNRIIRAKPYNASAKVVEGFFRQMNQQFFRYVPGWIDDNRMNPKRRELGKVMPPYENGIEEFWKLVFQLLKTYEQIPQKGALEGKSPSQVFESHVNAGWAATVIDEERFYLAFSKSETRKLEKHAFRLGGRLWSCHELDCCFERTVSVRVPAYHGFNQLLVETTGGKHIGWATPDRKFNYLDPRGAQTSAARDKDRRKALRDMKRSVPEIDVLGKLIEIGAHAVPIIPNEPAGVISVAMNDVDERAIVPSRSEKKTRQQMEDEQRVVDEARSLLVNAAAAMNKRAS